MFIAFRGTSAERMNFPDSRSKITTIFLGCWSSSKDTSIASDVVTRDNVSILAQGSPERFGMSLVCVRATVISSSFVIVRMRNRRFGFNKVSRQPHTSSNLPTPLGSSKLDCDAVRNGACNRPEIVDRQCDRGSRMVTRTQNDQPSACRAVVR
jgi:hypothetical protein